MKKYENEARERWGNTAAYHEHEQKTKNYTKEDSAQVNDGLMAIFAEFAMCKNSGSSADSADCRIANLTEKGDVIITQDYGLAALVLGKGLIRTDSFTPTVI